MIPNIPILKQEITEISYPGKTYKIVFSPANSVTIRGKALSVTSLSADVSDLSTSDRLNGFIDDIDSVIQAIYLILSTERYKFIIYSWDYGIELLDLIGKPMPYVMSELPRRITEALVMDDRIDDVIDFEFETSGSKLHTTFTVVTNIGNISTDLEVVV